MSRLAAKFNQLNAQGRKALIPFITAGDPAPDFTVPMMHAMVNAGADIIELGVPFSDPMADGPVIQRASERALEQHMSLRKVLQLVKQFRRNVRRQNICVRHGFYIYSKDLERKKVTKKISLKIQRAKTKKEAVGLLRKYNLSNWDPIKKPSLDK